jgi:hypothetical protein
VMGRSRSQRYSMRARRASSGSTRPVAGSVPCGRRNNRMCGSGLGRHSACRSHD